MNFVRYFIILAKTPLKEVKGHDHAIIIFNFLYLPVYFAPLESFHHDRNNIFPCLIA